MGVSVIHSQVGINTTTPTQDLDVNGNVNIENRLWIKGSPEVSNADVIKYLTVNTNGEVKTTDVTTTGALNELNFITYRLNNVEFNTALDFNTQINTATQHLVVYNFYFENANNNSTKSGELPQVYTYDNAGKWHITGVFSSVNASTIGNWYFYSIIIPKSNANILTEQVFDLNNGSTGSATAPPAGL